MRILSMVLLALVHSVIAQENCSAMCSGGPLPLNATLPNVLLVSDSIGANGTGYYTNVRAMMGWSASAVTGGGAVGNAAVQHSGAGWTAHKNYCGTSIGVIACAKQWLGTATFDVIHFNWGLHDICAKMYAPITRQQYANNMETLYQQLKAALKPNGRMIFATRTPVPPSYKQRNNTDVISINALARTLFGPGSKHPDVAVHDLYGQVVERCRREPAAAGYPQTDDCEFLQSRGVHFSDAGKQFTGIMTAAAIAGAL